MMGDAHEEVKKVKDPIDLLFLDAFDQIPWTKMVTWIICRNFFRWCAPGGWW
jgi:hypothetical protein